VTTYKGTLVFYCHAIRETMTLCLLSIVNCRHAFADEFTKCDADCSGKLSCDELSHLCHGQGFTDEDIQSIICKCALGIVYEGRNIRYSNTYEQEALTVSQQSHQCRPNERITSHLKSLSTTKVHNSSFGFEQAQQSCYS
jgi:hypothetical protein